MAVSFLKNWTNFNESISDSQTFTPYWIPVTYSNTGRGGRRALVVPGSSTAGTNYGVLSSTGAAGKNSGVCFFFKTGSFSSTTDFPIFTWDITPGNRVNISISNSAIKLRAGSTSIASYSFNFGAGGSYYLEAIITFDASSYLTAEVYLTDASTGSSVKVIDYPRTLTSGIGSSNIAGFVISNCSVDMTIDDVVLRDDYVRPSGSGGRFYVDYLPVDGAGYTSGFTASVGSGYTCVDETVLSNADDWIGASSGGVISAFTLQNFAPSGTIKAITPVIWESHTLSSSIYGGIRVNSTNYFTDNPGNGSLIHCLWECALYSCWSVNPNTSAPWSVSDINGLEILIKTV